MKLKGYVHYVGVNDRNKHRFEGLWALPSGVSYNAYLIADEQVALVDTVDAAFLSEFLDKIDALGVDRVDYLVINHMEPDHSGSIAQVRQRFPDIRVVGNAKTLEMLRGFYGEAALSDNYLQVGEGDVLKLGHHELHFHLVPMLHWPETMVSYDATERILFSGDAFGCFGALNGAVLDTQMDTTPYWPEMERYYASILGKYAAPVQTALRKLSALPIDMICSTHGPVWTAEAGRAIETYRRLSAGETEPGVVVCYGSMYGNTQRVAEAVAEGATEAGVHTIRMHNLVEAHTSFVLADIFRYRGLAVGAPTYNGGLFPPVEHLMHDLGERHVKGRKLACFGGFTWAGQAAKKLQAHHAKMGLDLVADPMEWKQGASADVLERGRALGRLLGEAVLAEQ